jgi:Ca2+-binding RTX toxin-like protein
MKAITGTIAFALLASVAGCSAFHDDTQGTIDSDNPTLAVEQNLTALVVPCTYNATTKDVAITIGATETALVVLRPDKSLVVNGYTCNDAVITPAVPVVVDGTAVKTVTASGEAGNNGLIIDYSGGAFATAANAISVDLKGGTDTFAFRGTTAADTVVMGATAIKVGTAANIKFTSQPDNVYFMLGDGNDSFNTGGDTATGAAYGLPVTVYGGAGNDTFVQGAATTLSETIYGGTGTDTVDYSLRSAVLNVTYDHTANDGLSGENDNINDDVDIVNGGSANDILDASGQVTTEGAVTLNGNAGNDTLVGSKIASYLVGSTSTRTKDKLNGGAGDDTFNSTATGDDGDDAYDGGAGTDVVSYASRLVTGVTVNMATTGGISTGGEADTYSATTENIIGSAVADIITGNALGNKITGGGGGDTLNGAAGADVFDQGLAATNGDTIDGGADLDTIDYRARSAAITCNLSTGLLCGASGEGDTLVVNATTSISTVENIWGATGAFVNTLTGDANGNEITGGSGIDVIDAGGGNDTIQTNNAGSSVLCGAGEDILLQSGKAVTLVGTAACEVVMP